VAAVGEDSESDHTAWAVDNSRVSCWHPDRTGGTVVTGEVPVVTGEVPVVVVVVDVAVVVVVVVEVGTVPVVGGTDPDVVGTVPVVGGTDRTPVVPEPVEPPAPPVAAAPPPGLVRVPAGWAQTAVFGHVTGGGAHRSTPEHPVSGWVDDT
jgi:uncharacterized membrane protein